MASRLIQRSDITDYQTYEDTRAEYRARIMELKKPRRIHLGEYLTFLFENRETLIYQIQEIMRAEKIARESAIADEIEVYNGLLGQPGDLGCALLIEIEEEADRKPLLTRWLGLQETLYLRLEDGTKVPASFDPMQVGDDRLSAVQYLRFPVGDGVPVAIGCDFTADEQLAREVELTPEQRAALLDDLRP